MKVILNILVGLLLGSCSIMNNQKVCGLYKSSCYNLGFPELEVFFYENATFKYKYAHDPDTIKGNWKIRKDTLFLYSKIFEKEIVDIRSFVDNLTVNPNSQKNPIVFNGQYTQVKNMDTYLIKCRYLYKITEKGFTKNCHLIKTKNY